MYTFLHKVTKRGKFDEKTGKTWHFFDDFAHKCPISKVFGFKGECELFPYTGGPNRSRLSFSLKTEVSCKKSAKNHVVFSQFGKNGQK